MALKWHPKLSKDDPNLTYHHFCEISEAYEVLGDCKHYTNEIPSSFIYLAYKRSFYDKYGEDKLKDGFIVDGSKLLSYHRKNLITLLKISEEATDLEEILKKFLRSSLDPRIPLLKF